MSLLAYSNYAIVLSLAMILVTIGSLGYDRGAVRFIPALYDGGNLKASQVLTLKLVGIRLLAATVLTIALVRWATNMDLIQAAIAASSEYLIVYLVAAIAFSESTIVIAGTLSLHQMAARLALFIIIIRLIFLFLFILFGKEISLEAILVLTIVTEGVQGAFLAAAIFSALWGSNHLAGDLPNSVPTDELGTVESAVAPDHAVAPSNHTVMYCCFSAWGAYLAGLPTQGPALRLLVGAFADTSTLAAFAFFQQLADRARMFLPMQLLLPSIETALAAQRQRQGDGIHVRVTSQDPQTGAPRASLAALSFMLRINLIVLVLAVLALVALGRSIELQLTGGRFADHLLLAGLMAFQLLLMSVGAALWSAYNAAGDAIYLNRVSILSSIGSIPIVFLAAYFYGAVGVAAVATVRVFGLAGLLLGNFGGEPARTLLFGHSERRKFCLVLICAVISLVGVVILQGRHFQDWLVFMSSASVFGLLIASTGAIDQGELKAMNTILGASLNRAGQPRGSC